MEASNEDLYCNQMHCWACFVQNQPLLAFGYSSNCMPAHPQPLIRNTQYVCTLNLGSAFTCACTPSSLALLKYFHWRPLHSHDTHPLLAVHDFDVKPTARYLQPPKHNNSSYIQMLRCDIGNATFTGTIDTPHTLYVRTRASPATCNK
jgi:hypothetical protein